MNDRDFIEQLMHYQDGALSPDEITALEEVMLADASKRKLFADAQVRSMALHDRFRQDAFQCVADIPVCTSAPRSAPRWITRSIAAMAAGLVIGLFSASLVWAISAPKATTERLFALINGSFEESRLESGFPKQTGFWSGDDAEIIAGDAREGRQRLRFVSPSGDAHDPSGRAISCDVYQLVDLRPLRAALRVDGGSVLELSADFLDARPHNTKPSVTFFCQLFLFKGEPATLHQSWPQSIADALSSGSAQFTTLGTRAMDWKPLTARCLVPAEAHFAVIQIAARPNLRPAKLDGLFADDVKLTLKTSPELPTRIVQR